MSIPIRNVLRTVHTQNALAPSPIGGFRPHFRYRLHKARSVAHRHHRGSLWNCFAWPVSCPGRTGALRPFSRCAAGAADRRTMRKTAPMPQASHHDRGCRQSQGRARNGRLAPPRSRAARIVRLAYMTRQMYAGPATSNDTARYAQTVHTANTVPSFSVGGVCRIHTGFLVGGHLVREALAMPKGGFHAAFLPHSGRCPAPDAL